MIYVSSARCELCVCRCDRSAGATYRDSRLCALAVWRSRASMDDARKIIANSGKHCQLLDARVLSPVDKFDVVPPAVPNGAGDHSGG